MKTYELRLTPLQYPIMRDLVLHGAFIGMDALQSINNGPVRNLHRRGLIVTGGTREKPRLLASDSGLRAVELYHRGKIAKRQVSTDITEYVRVMLRLARKRA